MPIPRDTDSQRAINDSSGTLLLLTVGTNRGEASNLYLDVEGLRAFRGGVRVGMSKRIGPAENMTYLRDQIQHTLFCPELVRFRDTGEIEQFECKIFLNRYRAEAFRIGFSSGDFYLSVKNTYTRHKLQLFEPIEILEQLVETIDEICGDTISVATTD